jgi:hypothetical protein
VPGGKPCIVLSSEFVDRGCLTKVGKALVVYLYLRRHIWRSTEGFLGCYWGRGLLVAMSSQHKIAEQLGLAKPTVAKHIERLRKAEWLDIVQVGKGIQSGRVFVLGDRTFGRKNQYIGEKYYADPGDIVVDEENENGRPGR